MKSYLVVTAVLGLGLLTTMSTTTLAHHGNAAYADEITEFKQATVTKFAWANPHTLINFDATDAKGQVVHMVVETAAPQALRLIGWDKASVMPGDVITVRMYVARTATRGGCRRLLADGRELRTRLRRAPKLGMIPRRQVTTWTPSIVVAVARWVRDHVSGRASRQVRRVHPMASPGCRILLAAPSGISGACGFDRSTPSPTGAAMTAGREALSELKLTCDSIRNAAWDLARPFITCDPLGFPRNLLAHAVSSRGRFIVGSAPDRLLITYEQQRVWREIWMDGRALPKAVDVRGAPESRYYGYSVGRWENDNTLVIDTTGLDERPWLDEVGRPRSSSARIQERYTRVDQYNVQRRSRLTIDSTRSRGRGCARTSTGCWARTLPRRSASRQRGSSIATRSPGRRESRSHRSSRCERRTRASL